MRHQIKFDWGMAPLLQNRKPGALVYGTNTVILSRARPAQRQAAWEFIKWFTSPEITARWALATGYVPVRRSARELPIMREEFERDPDSRVPIDMLDYAFFEPRWPEWLRARDFLAEGVKEALLGKLSPEQALRRAAEKGNFWLR
jgi:multiple sugar transport system substrate-binding protein